MRIIDCDQGSDEWRLARAGLPTASQFHKIITPKTLKFSAQAWDYANRLLWEWTAGVPFDDASGSFMERGRELEDRALDWYAFEKEVEPVAVGLCVTDDGTVGCSPDALVGEDGGIEIKCLSGPEHMGVLRAPDEFVESRRCQVQGCLWVTGRRWWDLLAYCPGLPSVLRRVEPEPEFQAALGEALSEFVRDLAAEKERLGRDFGLKAGKPPVRIPLPASGPMREGERVGESVEIRSSNWA